MMLLREITYVCLWQLLIFSGKGIMLKYKGDSVKKFKNKIQYTVLTCSSSMGVTESALLGPELVQESAEIVKLIIQRLQTAQSR